MTELREVADAIVGRFEAVNAARDRALNEGRQIVRLSANAIRAVHRGEYDDARELLSEAGTLLVELATHLESFPSLYWAGYVQDAMKEFAEATITLAVVQGEPIPGPSDVGVEDAAFLNALAESASELRREILDLLRSDDRQRAESLLSAMDEIYDLLVTIDFPDAVTGGLRRTTDQLRGVLERTRGDLTMSQTQARLERALREAEITFKST